MSDLVCDYGATAIQRESSEHALDLKACRQRLPDNAVARPVLSSQRAEAGVVLQDRDLVPAPSSRSRIADKISANAVARIDLNASMHDQSL